MSYLVGMALIICISIIGEDINIRFSIHDLMTKFVYLPVDVHCKFKHLKFGENYGPYCHADFKIS